MKKQILSIFITFIVTTIFLYSCVSESGLNIDPEGVVCETENVTFSNDISPIIATSCAISGCHSTGGSAPGNFETFDGLERKINDGSFENRVLVRMDMPPNRSLSQCDLDQIQSWLDAGALNN